MAKKKNKNKRKPQNKRLGRGLSSLITATQVATAEIEPSIDSDPIEEFEADLSATDEEIDVPSFPSDYVSQKNNITGVPLDPQDSIKPIAIPQISVAPADSAEISLDNIAANPYQPRHEFKSEELAELADSIRQQGILQPLLVIKASESQKNSLRKDYILVAGERRLRASRLAGLVKVPCVIKSADARQMLEWALIENIQREDLNPVDRARAYRDYVDRFNLTQQQAAQRLGEPRATIANYLRILDLCDDVQKMLLDGRLTFGHAKVLAGVVGKPELQLELAGRAAANNLSVRKLEELVANLNNPQADDENQTKDKPARSPFIVDLEEQLTQAVGTKVYVKTGKKKHSGKIVIEFYSLDDFDRISQSLGLKLDS